MIMYMLKYLFFSLKNAKSFELEVKSKANAYEQVYKKLPISISDTMQVFKILNELIIVSTET